MTGPTRRLGGDWYVAVQKRLPGHPVTSLTGPQFGILLDALLGLVERQADAGIAAEDRDFAGYVANVLFDGWDEVWDDTPRSCPAVGPLCERIRGWLQPVWGEAAAASVVVFSAILDRLAGYGG